MTRTFRRIWIGALLLLVAGFVALNGLAYNHAYAMMHYAPGGARTDKPEALMAWAKLKVLLFGVHLPRPMDNRPPSALAPGCRILSISVPGGITLSSWYCDQGQAAPLVILFHGYSAEKSGLLPEARTFLDLGASVMLVDFRGSGGSSESYTTLGMREAEDVAAAVRYANEHLPHSRLVLFGQSMGAAAILRAVNGHAVAPDAVILEAVFDSMLNTVRHRFDSMGIPAFPSAELLVFWGGRQWGFNGFAHNPVDYAKSLRCPALFMHGTDDPRAALADGRRVFDAAPGPKEFKTFDRTGHESYVAQHPAEWKDTVSRFLGTPDQPAPNPADTAFEASIRQLRELCPIHFLPDIVIGVTNDIKRPMSFGEPDPPEGFAGPDETGRHATGIYLPRTDKEWFPGDISNEQWVFHEMFHLHNRRLHDYDPFIAKAFPDETDPLVKWIKRSRYHRTFAREEAFINLISFADPARTDAQKEAVQEWYDFVSGTHRSLDEVRKAMKVIEHPPKESPQAKPPGSP